MFVAETAAKSGGWSVSAALGAGFSLHHVSADGDRVSGSLDSLWTTRFESSKPVRRVVAPKGHRSFAGLWWSSTMADHVGFESWLERDHLMLLDFDPDVMGVVSQPFWLSWRDGTYRRRHVPDFFVRLRDGSAVVIDVRPDDQIDEADSEVFAATARACAEVGWTYRRVGALDPTLVANVRWLSGYRHPRCARNDVAERLREAFAAPRGLADGAAAVGDPLLVRPGLFHLLWTGVLEADLQLVLLYDGSVVRAAAAS